MRTLKYDIGDTIMVPFKVTYITVDEEGEITYNFAAISGDSCEYSEQELDDIQNYIDRDTKGDIR